MREYLMPERLIFGQIDFTLLTHEPAQAAKIGGLRLIRMSQIVIEPIGGFFSAPCFGFASAAFGFVPTRRMPQFVRRPVRYSRRVAQCSTNHRLSFLRPQQRVLRDSRKRTARLFQLLCGTPPARVHTARIGGNAGYSRGSYLSSARHGGPANV